MEELRWRYFEPEKLPIFQLIYAPPPPKEPGTPKNWCLRVLISSIPSLSSKSRSFQRLRHRRPKGNNPWSSAHYRLKTTLFSSGQIGLFGRGTMRSDDPKRLRVICLRGKARQNLEGLVMRDFCHSPADLRSSHSARCCITPPYLHVVWKGQFTKDSTLYRKPVGFPDMSGSEGRGQAAESDDSR